MDDCMIRTKKFRRMISPFLFACWIDDQKFNRQRVSEILFTKKLTSSSLSSRFENASEPKDLFISSWNVSIHENMIWYKLDRAKTSLRPPPL